MNIHNFSSHAEWLYYYFFNNFIEIAREDLKFSQIPILKNKR